MENSVDPDQTYLSKHLGSFKYNMVEIQSTLASG